ncbi:MAG: ferrous iron transport protein B [Erysipelotrichaceae bacterium]|nr:ferrous iron transport protein B [Erysipelotrichaceae bacterium]MDD4642403.1 ferrous iron transport protein B [Erysipelotrichaceae bacterium]
MAKYKIGLIGNQNSGKSTLFNALTGSNQHVGNFPGVTVERKEGLIKGHKDIMIVDLPGIYSLSPYTKEEILTREFLMKDKPDAIINIIDATSIERSLYLTLQLIELQIPMILAVNMIDEVELSGNMIDDQELSKQLGITALPISAMRNKGIKQLIEEIDRTVKNNNKPIFVDFCSGEIHRAVHAIAHLIEPTAQTLGYNSRFIAIKLVEGDHLIKEELRLHDQDQVIIDQIIKDMEYHLNMDNEAAMADMRYTFIEKVVKKVYSHNGSLQQDKTDRIDKVLTHRLWSIPIFLSVMAIMFYLTFGPVGGTLQGWLETLLEIVIGQIKDFLIGLQLSPWLQGLLVDGALTGISSVLSFVPIIVTLFFFLSILEDTGYMARVAYVMDKLLQKLGLSGKSFVPMIIGFGCTVPAVIATRTLASTRDRKLTIMLLPFMSCTAKLPIYALFTAAFFDQYQALVMILLYLFGILIAILSALLLKNTVFKGDGTPFVLELPTYRFPLWQNVIRQMWEKAKDFIERAFTIIFLASMLIWLLSSFDLSLHMVAEPSQSMLAILSSKLAFIFRPLGFDSWQAVSALVTGLTAKEAVVSTLGVLLNTSGDANLINAIAQLFTPLSAVSFLVFTLLYTPCFAAVAAIKREIVSLKETILILAYQLGVAWLVAFFVYRIILLIWG